MAILIIILIIIAIIYKKNKNNQSEKIQLNIKSPLRNTLIDKYNNPKDIVDKTAYGLMLSLLSFNYNINRQNPILSKLSNDTIVSIENKVNSDIALLYIAPIYYYNLTQYILRNKLHQSVLTSSKYSAFLFYNEIMPILGLTDTQINEIISEVLWKHDKDISNKITSIISEKILNDFYLDDELLRDLYMKVSFWSVSYMPATFSQLDSIDTAFNSK